MGDIKSRVHMDLKSLKKKYSTSDWSMKRPMYIDKKDKRYNRAVNQLKNKGFSLTETWNLNVVIAKFILPRLICFREENRGYPSFLETPERWDEILDKMIFAFDWFMDHENLIEKYNRLSEKEQTKLWKQYEEGMQLFAKHFMELWW